MTSAIVDLALDLPEHWLPVPVERDLTAGRQWAIETAQQLDATPALAGALAAEQARLALEEPLIGLVFVPDGRAERLEASLRIDLLQAEGDGAIDSPASFLSGIETEARAAGAREVRSWSSPHPQGAVAGISSVQAAAGPGGRGEALLRITLVLFPEGAAQSVRLVLDAHPVAGRALRDPVAYAKRLASSLTAVLEG